MFAASYFKGMGQHALALSRYPDPGLILSNEDRGIPDHLRSYSKLEVGSFGVVMVLLGKSVRQK